MNFVVLCEVYWMILELPWSVGNYCDLDSRVLL